MPEKPHSADVLIVGAGLAGLMAGRALRERGLAPLLVDKGRSVGGRLATRRIGPGKADHGAQFFTAETPVFRKVVAGWLDDGLCELWTTGWSEGSIDPDRGDALPRYMAPKGMNALAKTLAQGLEVHTSVKLASLGLEGDQWVGRDEEGRAFAGRAAIVTPPVPQTLALIDAGGVELSKDERYALRRVEYVPNLTGLFWIEGDTDIPAPGYLEFGGRPARWISDNQAKGLSPEACLITVQMSHPFSSEHYDADDEETLDLIEAELRPQLAENAVVKERQLKRWRYAGPMVVVPGRTLVPAALPHLVFAGDAFGGLRFEGACLSGIEAAERAASALAG